MQMKLKPIGVIENEFLDRIPEGWETALHQIVLDPRWTAALEGIEKFSHLFILFWLHGIHGEIQLHVHPENRRYLPEVGIFATRTPRRPNPIGLQVVELVSRQGNVLTVRRLDALNGTPVLDVKPYLPRGDALPRARTPEWVGRLLGDAR
jgi:tRNA-Thr(GGU) m(6)t(6)A37 methyltransferase TsaA